MRHFHLIAASNHLLNSLLQLSSQYFPRSFPPRLPLELTLHHLYFSLLFQQGIPHSGDISCHLSFLLLHVLFNVPVALSEN